MKRATLGAIAAAGFTSTTLRIRAMVIFIALALLALPGSAAPLLHQQAGEYEVQITSLGAVFPNYDLAFDGPSGTKHFAIHLDSLQDVVLGSRGVVAISGAFTNELLMVIRYDDAPVSPLHVAQQLSLDIGIPYPPGLDRTYRWVPIPYIQYEQLFAQLRGEGPGFPGSVLFTHNYGIEMGVQAIPEPVSVGLFAIGCGLVWISRRER